MKIYNLTGSEVTIVTQSGERRVFKPERFVAKAMQEHVAWNDTDGITTLKTAWHISGLPAQQDGIVYLVPAGVLLAALVSGRSAEDLRAPAGVGEDGSFSKLVMA